MPGHALFAAAVPNGEVDTDVSDDNFGSLFFCSISVVIAILLLRHF